MPEARLHLRPSGDSSCQGYQPGRVHMVAKPLIALSVITNGVAGLHRVITVDDDAPEFCPLADRRVIHDDRFLDIRTLPDAHAMTDDTAPQVGVEDDAAHPD